MEEYRSTADVLNEKERRESSHRRNIKKSPSAKDDTIKKEMKRKMEGNSTPRSPFILRKKRSKPLTALRYRSLLNKQKENAEDIEIENSPDSNSEMQDARKSMCLRCTKLKRKSNDSDHRFCSCSTPEGEGSAASFEDSEGIQMKPTCSGETGQGDDSYDLCVKCKQPGSLMHCDGKDCKRCYHLSCLDPPLSNVPFGLWLCICCLRKKLEFGVHSVSQGIESILDSRNDEQKGKLYFVKYKGLAHIHNLWIPKSQLLMKDSALLTKFAKKQQRGQEIGWKHEWTEPHRLLQRRFWVPPDQIDACSCGHGDNIEYCYVEWLVKWKGLGYEFSTWEFENSEFLCSANGKALMDEFERRRLEAKKTLNPSQTNKDICVRENPLKKFSKLADELPVEHNNEILISVCNIINLWHKNRNAILIHDQEAKVKSIVFISHLLSYTCLPFLIISTVHAFSKWEAEFAHLAPSINIVVYSGNRNAREIMRSLEFYEEGGCVMFKVLITSPDVVVKDLQYLNCLGWEGIIIDDCQTTGVSKHFEQFAILSSEFRLLILNSVPKETVADYYKLLSFLDIKGQSSPQNSKSDSSENGDELSILKKRLKRYIVHAGKRTSSVFLEYWVPIQLSALQLKQYCNILTSNSFLLRSRFDYVESLLDVLKSIRMCCDHPYLADHSLQDSLVSGFTEKECLNVGVNASSKLQLLDKILLKMKNLGRKVLILIQLELSKYHLGHIIDDFLCERFGEASFVYINKLIEKPKIESILRKFNDAKSETFVTVIEKLACRPRIKLSSVDAVIIFNSDWNPVNDMKALKKITFCSQTQPVKIFRLYSPYTVEEKILCLAKDDMGIETDIENTSTKFRHSLLTWGASCLFDKLNQLDNSHAHSESLIDKSLLKEMLYLLATPAGNDDNFIDRKCSNIVYAHTSGDSYSRNISLCGEKVESALVHGDPVIFWSKLLETITPPHTSGSSQSTRHVYPQISEKNDDMRKSLPSIPALESSETQKESTSHTAQLHTSSNENQLNLGVGEMKEDATNPIFEVEKIFSERMGQILLKQEQETKDCKRQSKEETQILERCHDSVFRSVAAKDSKVKEKLRKKILEEREQFDLHLKLQRKKLRIMQIEARNKEKQLKGQWLEKARRGIVIKPYESLPLTDTGFRYEYFNIKELLKEANDDESRCLADPSTTNQNEVQTHSKRIPFERTLPQAEEFPEVPSLTSKEMMEDIMLEKKNPDSTTSNHTRKGHDVMEAETEALDVTSLHNALNSNQLDPVAVKDNSAISLHGRKSNRSSDTTILKLAVGTDRNRARTDYCISQGTDAHGAQEQADNISDSMCAHCTADNQHEPVHINSTIEDDILLCHEEPEQVIFQSEHADNSPESEHPLNSPESEHPYNNAESVHTHNSSEPVACSDLRRVPPVPNPSPETTQPNNVTTRTYQPEFNDFVPQLFAASQPIPPEEFNLDPLQNVLTIMRHQEYSISSSHQRRKLALAEECEKELEEVRRKHSALVQHEEEVCKQRLKVIKELQYAVEKNRILAELFSANFIENNTCGNLVEVQGQMGESVQKSLKLGISQNPILPSPSNPTPVHPVHPVRSSPPRTNLPPSLVVRSPQGQMGSLMQKSPKTYISKMPVSPSLSSTAQPFPFRPPSSVVHSPSVLSSASNSQTMSQNNLTSLGDPDQAMFRPLTIQTASNVHFRAPAPHLRRYRPE